MKRMYLMSILLLSVVTAQTVDFDTQIQPIFNASCTGCHGNSAGLDLATGQSYDNLVDVVSTNYAPALRVVSGDPTLSVLYNKVAGNGTNGQQMPVGGSLTPDQIALIGTWITELGAVIPITIAEARETPEGEVVTIEGIVTSGNFGTAGSRTEYTVQDPTAALVVYAYGFDAGLLVGDAVTITGELDSYNGKFEIVPASPTDVVVETSGNDLPAFQVLTIAEILADGEAYEAELVRVDSATIIGGDAWPTSGNNANMTISDPSGETMTMRIDKDTDVDENDQIMGYFNLQSIIGQYDSTDPYDEGYQVFPRFYTDFEQIGDPTPQITDISQDPASPTPTDDVTISAVIVDNSSVASASLNYTVNAGVEMVVVMIPGENDSYAGVIPAQVANAVVIYTISATDDLGGVSTSNEMTYLVYGGDITPIASLQDGTVPSGTSVTIEGIVTAEPYAFYPEDDLHYFYIQDAQAAYSGIMVYDVGRAVVEGDEIRLTGTVTEYYDLTEMVDVTEFEILSSGNIVEPLVVTLQADMEPYEGCLIEIQGVAVSNPDLGYGEWSVTDGTNELVLDDKADYFYTPVQDEALASVVGVLDYSWGAFKLLPRLARDIQTNDGLTRIQAIQQVNYSDIMPHYDALDSSIYFADTSYYHEGWTDTTIVTVQGIVTMPTGLSYAGNGIKFILQDVNGGPWSSILSYHPDSSAFPVLFEGDMIEISGRIMEFTTPGSAGSSAMTELWITQEIELINFDVPVPEVPVVATGDLRWPTTAEQWGNVMVKVVDATIVELNPTGFDIMALDDGSGIVYVDDDSDSLGTYILPPAGSVFDEVRGWIYHHYGSYEDSTTYKLVPLYESDLVLNTDAIDNLVVPEGYALGNYPNPFNPSTNIAFSIPEAQTVRLIIYNQRGQHVVTLMNRPLQSGDYEVTWQGLNAAGKPVSSGLYFYRMIAGTEQLVGKMTYLK
ncbi:MAG: FlgD immunoglobulin-like domain containing protein [Candidatus Marinimicrobia bacterium]|nr:FlgD immunoglobulin-like domain containing protein [Candidatus Neomarinimicrobiota bacterium]